MGPVGLLAPGVPPPEGVAVALRQGAFVPPAALDRFKVGLVYI